ncbi:MAG: amino acid permease [Ignavibacteriales bacterium]|nr:amino acid permease [Ignavibacteriales bacterium]
MIGSGIFIVPATVAAGVKAPLVMLAVWIAGGIACMFGALALAELAAAFSETGGIYVYLREAYGPLVAVPLRLGAACWSSTRGPSPPSRSRSPRNTCPTSSLSGPSLRRRRPSCSSSSSSPSTYVGVRQGAFAAERPDGDQVRRPRRGSSPSSSCSPGATGEPRDAPAVRRSAVISSASSAWPSWRRSGPTRGSRSSTFNAGETTAPVPRRSPWASSPGCGLVTLLYILTNIAYLYAVPAAGMAGSERIAADAMNAAVGPVGASLVAFIILFSIMGAANGHIMTGPRVYYAMAKDGLFFRRDGRDAPADSGPRTSRSLMVGAWSIALSLEPSGKFEEMLKFAVFGAVDLPRAWPWSGSSS